MENNDNSNLPANPQNNQLAKPQKQIITAADVTVDRSLTTTTNQKAPSPATADHPFPPPATGGDKKTIYKGTNALKYLFFALIAALILIAGFILLVLRPTKSVQKIAPTSHLLIITPRPTIATTSAHIDTSSWQIYNSPQNTYYFKYPQDWTVSQTELGIQIQKTFHSGGGTMYPSYTQTITVVEKPVAPTTTLESWLKSEYGGDQKLFTDYIKPSAMNVTISSVSAIAVDLPGYASTQKATLFINNGIGYDIQKNDIEIANSGESDVYKGIEESFTFTNQIQSSISPTCRPRPKCLDSNPQCEIAITDDMCPPSPGPITK